MLIQIMVSWLYTIKIIEFSVYVASFSSPFYFCRTLNCNTVKHSFEMLKGQYGLKDHLSILFEKFIFYNNNLNNYYLINLLKKINYKNDF